MRIIEIIPSSARPMAGEEGARAVIKPIEGRIEDWKAGTFSAPNITH